MIAYADSSVLLRIVLRQPKRLPEWKDLTAGVASALVQVECLRTLDRLVRQRMLTAEACAVRREAVFRLMEEMSVVDVTNQILSRASEPLPVALGTLDAIHLATAQTWREQREPQLVMATHDVALAEAARASGLRVVGA